MRVRLLSLAGLALIGTLLLGCPPPASPPAKEGAKPATPAESAAKAPGKTAAKPAAAAKGEETGPIAVVNGEEVPRAEFNEMYEKMTRVYTRRSKPVPENVARRHKQNIVNRLVEKTLLRQAIKKAGIVVTPAELDEGLAKYKEMFRTEANFERYLKSSNTTLDKIKDNIRFNKALDKLLAKDGPIAVSEAEMKEYYEKNKRRYEVKEMVKAGHILIRLKKGATEAEKAAAKKKAQDIEKEARKKGADFKQLAIKHSEGPTGPKGGDLGFFTKGRMAPEFEKAAFAMKAGEISKPVLTQFGYHIIKVYEKKSAGQKSFDEVKDSIAKLLESRAKRKRKSEMLRELKKTATIVNNLKIPAAAPRRPASLKLTPSKSGVLTVKPPAAKTLGAKRAPTIKPAAAPAPTPSGTK